MIRHNHLEIPAFVARHGMAALQVQYPLWDFRIDGRIADQRVDVTARRRAWDQEARQRGRHAMCRGVLQHAKRRAA